MSVPFDFFFGILGLVAGMVIVWLLESRHAFEPNEEPWTLPDPVEPSFIAAEMTKRGHPIEEDAVAEILDIHLAYLDGRASDEEARSRRIVLARARRELAAEAGAAEGETGEGPTAGATEYEVAAPGGRLPEDEALEEAAAQTATAPERADPASDGPAGETGEDAGTVPGAPRD